MVRIVDGRNRFVRTGVRHAGPWISTIRDRNAEFETLAPESRRRRFAVEVMSRDERTIRRWLAGEVMPEGVAAWLARVESVTVGPRTGKLTIVLAAEEKA